MAINIIAVAVKATKMASGNVKMEFLGTRDNLNASEDLRFAIVIPAADFTAFNTTVNGGATDATLTKVYLEDANRNDYPLGYACVA
jgi:hypothetical protein